MRITIDGDVQAVGHINLGTVSFRANGLAVSSDGQVIYVTGTTPGGGGVLLSVPAFGQSTTTTELIAQAAAAAQTGTLADMSRFMFTTDVSPSQGLGPLFNGQSQRRATVASSGWDGGTGPDRSVRGRLHDAGVRSID